MNLLGLIKPSLGNVYYSITLSNYDIVQQQNFKIERVRYGMRFVINLRPIHSQCPNIRCNGQIVETSRSKQGQVSFYQNFLLKECVIRFLYNSIEQLAKHIIHNHDVVEQQNFKIDRVQCYITSQISCGVDDVDHQVVKGPPIYPQQF